MYSECRYKSNQCNKQNTCQRILNAHSNNRTGSQKVKCFVIQPILFLKNNEIVHVLQTVLILIVDVEHPKVSDTILQK